MATTKPRSCAQRSGAFGMCIAKATTRQKLRMVAFCAILAMLPFPDSGNRGEVRPMEAILTDFLVAVAAQVTAYYLCKWLNDHHKGK